MARPEERSYYLHFKRLVPELAGATDDLEHERPDVLATLPGRTIGVELTGYYHGKAPKGNVSQAQVEAFEYDVVLEAQRIFESEGGPPLYVSAGWFGHPVKERAEVLARALADTVAANLPTVPATETYVSLRLVNHELPDSLSRWISGVDILRTARDTAHFWTVPQAGYPDANPAGVRERIAAKEKLLRSYRPCDEMWLLIHSSHKTMASAMTWSELARDEEYATAFDRVYALDLSGNVHRFRTKP